MNTDQQQALAKDKYKFKRFVESWNIPTPYTFGIITQIHDIHSLNAFPSEFVLKPNNGYGGYGILILKKQGDVFVTPSGRTVTLKEVKHHIELILDGQFSEYMENDFVLVEERIYPSPKLEFKDSLGLCDIRICCEEFKPVMAMWRYPTVESNGKANLTAGALGLGIDMETGRITSIYDKKQGMLPREYLGIPEDFCMPKWEKMKAFAAKVAKASGLRFAGVDAILDSRDRVMVLEINGFPGLEIQNVNRKSFLESV